MPCSRLLAQASAFAWSEERVWVPLQDLLVQGSQHGRMRELIEHRFAAL